VITMYVLDVPEFKPLVVAAQGDARCRVAPAQRGYWKIESDIALSFERRAMQLKPAIWYGAFTGGLDGAITDFGKDQVHVVAADRSPRE
jgi:hypothetical protein